MKIALITSLFTCKAHIVLLRISSQEDVAEEVLSLNNIFRNIRNIEKLLLMFPR